jgi:hypothetical protein
MRHQDKEITMYIVIGLNQDEFGRGNARPVHKFVTIEELRKFIMSSANADRFEIYEAKKLNLTVDIG